MSQKLAYFPILLAAASLLAAVYGAIHNQFSYMISPEFFHTDLFFRFDLPDWLRNRLGASVVGWRSTWWMGVLIGLPILMIGLSMPDRRTYVKYSLIAFALVALVAICSALVGLLFGVLLIDTSNAPMNIFVSPEAGVRMGQAGMMHNFGYFGGLPAVFLGSLYMLYMRKLSTMTTRNKESSCPYAA